MKVPRPLKWLLWIVGTLAILFVTAVYLMVRLFSGLLGEPSSDEVARVVSPSGKVDAVLFEINGGATTSFGYWIYAAEHGAQAAGSPAISLSGAVRNQGAYGANLKWMSPESVAVEFLSAQSVRIERQTQSIGNQTIHFAVHQGVTDDEAPPGGMLYNLRGRP